MEVTPLRNSVCFVVKETHDVGNSRRQLMAIAAAMGFDETLAGKAALIATEFATNLVKHGGGGRLVMRGLDGDGASGIEILSLDKGPGMDADTCLRDGYSTSGSPGTGLGAVNRLADRFDIYSVPGKGTTLAAILWRVAPADPALISDYGAVCLPIESETLCGDGWAMCATRRHVRMMVSDGLGHGPAAAEVSDAAIALFNERDSLAPGAFIQLLNERVTSSRGAAVAMLEIDLDRNLLTFAGIGNIAGYIFTGVRSRGMVSLNGIVGHQLRKVSEFSYECLPGDLVMLHSDGLSTHWKLEDYPGLAYRPANIVAGTFYRDFSRHKDDATILTLRRP